LHLRKAFNAAAIRQYSDASAEVSAAINSTEDPRVKGWLQEQLACYVHQTDPAGAQQVLAGALKHNPRVTHPMEGVSYTRLSIVADQAYAAAEYLRAGYADRNALLVGVDALLDDLVLEPEHTDEFEDAVDSLALHLGFGSQRPERDIHNGPDVLWAVGSLRYLVIECKSGAVSDRIWRRDVEQLAHSMNWFDQEYDHSCTAVPVMVHRTKFLETNATAPLGTRVITAEKLERLQSAVRATIVALADAGTWSVAEQIGVQLRHHHLDGPSIVNHYSVPVRTAPG
jgi:hypothetical protein